MLNSLKTLFGGKDAPARPEYWRSNVALTLMAYQYDLEIHIETEYRYYDYFFRLSPEWKNSEDEGAIQEKLSSILQQIYQEHRQRLQIAEPNDPNYIAIAGMQFQKLNPEEASARPWEMNRPPVWESSACIIVEANGFSKAETEGF